MKNILSILITFLIQLLVIYLNLVISLSAHNLMFNNIINLDYLVCYHNLYSLIKGAIEAEVKYWKEIT